ncbi:ferritin family protein [candidate division KSB1 bacterium]|nr:ferritin family protein [candidate division KSB1 bacterium]
MGQSLTIQEALKVAINAEINAYNLYMNTRDKVSNAGTKTMLKELADQELGHRKLLENVLAKENYEVLGRSIPQQSQGISDFLVVSELQKDASPQDVIIFAMNEEQKAFRFYSDLQAYFKGSQLETLFSNLAGEEQQHKLKLEKEYEEHFMKEN